MNDDMESRPADEVCVVPIAPLGESVYRVTDEEWSMIVEAGLEPVDHGPNGKPIFALEDVLAYHLNGGV